MTFDLNIDSLAFGGNGVGRLDGKAVFVPLTAPGDHVRCRVLRDRKKFVEAEAEELLIPASSRRTPPCPVFGNCGGCQWQHLPYAEQALWKERIFRDFFTRHCRIAENRIRSIVQAPDEWFYRSRVQFKCRQADDRFVMGFYRRGSHFVVDVDHCPITALRLNEVLRLFRDWLPSSPAPERIPQVDLELGDDGKVRAVVHCLGEGESLGRYLRPLAEGAEISLFLQSGRKDSLRCVTGDEDLAVLAGDPPLALAYGPGGFSQVNPAQNRALVREALEAAALSGRERVLDLYCGMGNFSLPMALKAREVVGVEEYAPAIRKARENAARLGIGNARFEAAPAEGAALRYSARDPLDLIVLDPPRAGAYSVTRALPEARPERILYISCDPSTLVRDLQPLIHGGYRLEWSRPFDLFPQTSHIESMTLLKRC